MSDGKKKRLSMLDNLAAAGAPAPAPMMTTNRALRSAREAVDSHHVWELDPNTIDDTRPTDRMESDDVYDLRDAIETNGQTVPILVRRHPTADGRYLLVYGRRRLEAIKLSGKVEKVRALVANLNDDDAVRAQISENMARRDLSFIEKALFARELVDQKFGTQSEVAEILTVTKSAISMALSVVDTVTPALAQAIGPAHGIGRPRWDNLAKSIADQEPDMDALIQIAQKTRDDILIDVVTQGTASDAPDGSMAAFEAVQKALIPTKVQAKSPAAETLTAGDAKIGRMKRSGTSLKIEITDPAFANWLERQGAAVLTDLHAKSKR